VSVAPCRVVAVIVEAFLLIASAGCGRAGPPVAQGADAVLRMGVAQIDIGQLVQNLTIEGLVASTNDGRAQPWLAKTLSVSPDGLSIDIGLRPDARFQDGSAISPQLVADTLRTTLPKFAGPVFSDVASIGPVENDRIEIKLHRPSRFIPEALETTIQEPGSPTIGTGAFMSIGAGSASEVLANPSYYLQAPAIGRIEIKTYPSVRAAWADMLRGGIDMVYEVGLEELDSLQTAKTINVFSFTRRYQYAMIFNSKASVLQSRAIRRDLNAAIDRPALVRDALGGHGVPSSGPVWPDNWAAQPALPTFTFDPQGASNDIALNAHRSGRQYSPAKLQFGCLVGPDGEKVALVLRRQLEAVGVDVTLEAVSRDEFVKRVAKGSFDALLTSIISGPTIFRPYLWWLSGGPLNRFGYGDPAVDAALEQVRHAVSDDEYRSGVERFQRSILADPPAVFLAWDERARAVSNRFEVAAQPGTDIMRTLHLWRPAAGAAHPGSN
jgi:peptide/nickel transport system substrate-binding protein